MTTEDDIKPNTNPNEVENVLSRVYGLKGSSVTMLHGYDDLNYHCFPKFSCNPFVKEIWHHGYVLKVMNSLDSKKDDLVEAQNSLMFYLREQEITAPVPVKTMKGEYYTKAKLGSKTHVVRVLEFQPGKVLKQVRKSFDLLYDLGKFLGKINEALKEFSHEFYETHYSIWHLKSVPQIKSIIEIIQNPERKQLVGEVIDKFVQDVLSKTESFEKGMIHGDFNEHNILIKDEPGKAQISAILDLGDSHNSYYLFELAVALCYMMLECKEDGINPVIGAGHVLAGYLSVRSSFSVDYSLLKLCICARLCQSLVLGLKAFSLHPENDYVKDTQEKGWPLLEELWEFSNEKLTEDWDCVLELYKVNNTE